MAFTEQLIQMLKEKGCEMGYNKSTWYALSEIEKFSKEIEKTIDKSVKVWYNIYVIKRDYRKRGK